MVGSRGQDGGEQFSAPTRKTKQGAHNIINHDI